MNRYFICLLLMVSALVQAQNVNVQVYGQQANGQKAVLKTAILTYGYPPQTKKVDAAGQASIDSTQRPAYIVISANDFDSDTLFITADKNDYAMMLLPQNVLGAVDITSRNYDVKIDMINPIKVESIGEKELKKAACCNLAESFESNASVDVVYTDALTGARTVQMLGLSGLYAPIQIENVPYTRGLSANFGMSFIPGTWLNSIQITKGVGSVVNGFESMAGIINVELIKPENHKTENLFVNVYGNSMGRAEANVHLNKKFNDKWSTLLMLHGNGNYIENDMNKDDFRDNPLSNQINVLNRWKRQGEKTEQVIMVHSLYDEKQGGQLGSKPGIENNDKYGVGIKTQIHEVYFKNGFMFPKKEVASLGLIGSYRYQENKANFGMRIFDATQHSGYFNSIYSNYIGNKKHTVKTGLSLIYDQTNVFTGVSSSQTELIPGAFLEYNYSPAPAFSMLVGQRVDYHNQFGLQYTPRIHLRYEINEKTALRVLAGTGFRTSKTLMENMSALASSRIILIDTNLIPEKSFNTGISLTKEFKVGKNLWMLNADYYYTQFMNQVVIDYDMNPRELNVYNLTGASFAHSAQVELDMKFSPQLQFKLAYKYYNVQLTTNNILQSKALLSPNRIMGNISYQTQNKKWKIDVITNWIDGGRIPSTASNPEPYVFPEKGEPLYIVHVQVTKLFKKFEVYVGGENLLNQTQHHAIVAADDPFGQYFDAGLIWGPLNGTTIYGGLRYSLRR